VVEVASDDGRCNIILQNGVLMPGMSMPVLGPPPPDPHPNQVIRRMRDAWNLHIIAWEAVWDARQPRWERRRAADHWRDPNPFFPRKHE
jgi:hypothetical protein